MSVDFEGTTTYFRAHENLVTRINFVAARGAMRILTTLRVSAVLLATSFCTLGQTVKPLDTIEQLRSAVKTGGSIDIGPVHVQSVERAYEVGVGHDRIVVIVVGRPTGAIASFAMNSKLTDAIKTGPIVSFQVFDLDEDDVAEIATDEIDGVGTGILLRQFRLYTFGGGGNVRRIWEAKSFLEEENPSSPQNPRPSLTREYGYLRFDYSGAGKPARMSYAIRNAQGHWQVKTLRLVRGHIQQVE